MKSEEEIKLNKDDAKILLDLVRREIRQAAVGFSDSNLEKLDSLAHRLENYLY